MSNISLRVAPLKAHIQLRGSAVSCEVRPVFERQGRNGNSNLPTGDYADRRPCERPRCVFSVAGRPVTGDSVTRVKEP